MSQTVKHSERTKVSQLIGKTVYTQQEGRCIGKITEAIFSPDEKILSSVIIKDNVWSDSAYKVSSMSIKKISSDLVYVDSITNCKLTVQEKYKGEHSYDDLDGNRIITEEGKFLGILSDISFDKKTFRINELIMEDTASVNVDSNVIVLGKDEIIIPQFYEELVIRKERIGLFAKLFSGDHNILNLNPKEELTEVEKTKPTKATQKLKKKKTNKQKESA